MTEIEKPLLQILMNRVFLPPTQRDDSAARAGEDQIGAPLRVLDGALAGRRYLLSGTFTIADLNVASVLSWALIVKLDLGKTPNVERWLRECCARPAFAKAQKDS
jgi:glutathione S-transferase